MRCAHASGTHLVKRRISVSVPLDTLALAERLLERLAEREAAVLGRVVVVNVQVALALDGEAHAAVLGERGEHLGVSGPRRGRRARWAGRMGGGGDLKIEEGEWRIDVR